MMKLEELMEKNLFVKVEESETELTFGNSIGSLQIDITLLKNDNTFYVIEDNIRTEKKRKRYFNSMKWLTRYVSDVNEVQENYYRRKYK